MWFGYLIKMTNEYIAVGRCVRSKLVDLDIGGVKDIARQHYGLEIHNVLKVGSVTVPFELPRHMRIRDNTYIISAEDHFLEGPCLGNARQKPDMLILEAITHLSMETQTANTGETFIRSHEERDLTQVIAETQKRLDAYLNEISADTFGDYQITFWTTQHN